MKKNYMQPTTDVVKICLESHLLDLSGDYVKSGNASGDLDNLSRGGGSFWDDED